MSQLIEVPNYGQVEFPDDMSDEDITKAIKKTALGYKSDSASAKPKGKSYEFQNPLSKDFTPIQNLKENLPTFGKGALMGAVDIGKTIVNASSYYPRKLEKLIGGHAMNDYVGRINSDAQEINNQNEGDAIYGGGRMAGNIAGTAGVGGGLGAVLKAGSKTPQALALAESLSSGGLTGANAGYKLAGGVTAGALGSALIDPESTKYGAMAGAAVPVLGQALPMVGSGIANLVGGLRTNTGGQAIKTAARAGLQGGKAQASVIDNMRGNVPLEDVVNVAERKLSEIGQNASKAYRSGMVDIKGDKSILDFGGIDKTLERSFNDITFKGQVKDEAGAKVLQSINQEISNWKSLDPSEFHTPEGLDALKQKIGSIVEGVDPIKEKNAKRIGNSIYGAIKNEISSQAPTYAKVMKDYSEGMDEINEIRKTLSIGGKASNDTKLRKLQSVMRNNVNTNYGQREKLVGQLERGSGDITNAVAGQSLNDWLPKGLGKLALTPTAIAGGLLGGIPSALALAASSSPRLVGETALKVGQGARYVRNAAGKLVPLIPAGAGLLNQ